MRKSVGARDPGDALENDADQQAASAMRAVEASGHELAEPTEERMAGGRFDRVFAAKFAGDGRLLPIETRDYFGQRFGRKMEDVRVHTDEVASEVAAALGARAFTLGSSIFFGSGQFAPGTLRGDDLLAHELAHVVQQRESRNANVGIQMSPWEEGAPAYRRGDETWGQCVNRSLAEQGVASWMLALSAAVCGFGTGPAAAACIGAVVGLSGGTILAMMDACQYVTATKSAKQE